VFLLHAATALEHLAKAVLAARHPSLTVATNDFESLLHACGESGFARRPRAKMRTIAAGDAIGRASRFVPTVEALVPDLELLILVRNGIAHLGEASVSDADDVLVAYLKASEELRDTLDVDRGSYRGEFLDLVDSAFEKERREGAPAGRDSTGDRTPGVRQALRSARPRDEGGDASRHRVRLRAREV
jgi:hypothetical protein